MALAADVIAGPPAFVVAAAAALKAYLLYRPLPLQERQPWWPTSLQALLPASPPPPSMPTSWKPLTPSGRGAVALAADVVAGPPAFVVAASAL